MDSQLNNKASHCGGSISTKQTAIPNGHIIMTPPNSHFEADRIGILFPYLWRNLARIPVLKFPVEAKF